MNRGEKLVRGSAVRGLNFLLSIAISFYLMPFLVRELGANDYGLWTLVGSFIGYFGLMDIGLSSAVSRFISRAIGQDNTVELKKIISTSFYLFLGLGVFAALATVGLSLILPRFMDLKESTPLFQTLLLLLGISFAFDFPVRAFNAVFSSNLREDISSGITIIKNIFCVITIYFVVRKGHGVLGLAIASVAYSLIDNLFRVALSFHIEPRTTVDLRFFDRAWLRPLFNYSFLALVGRIANLLKFSLGQIIITRYLTLTAVTHYFVGTRLIEYLTLCIMQVISVITPLFSQDDGNNNYDAIRSNFLFASKLSLYSSIFFCGLMYFYGRFFIQRWMGPDYSDSIMVLFIFLIPTTLQLIQAPVIPVLDGTSNLKYYVFPNLIEGVLNVALSLILVKDYGMYGVALGTAIPMTLKHLFFQPHYVSRAIGLDFKLYVKEMAVNSAIGFGWLLLNWIPLHWMAHADYPSLILLNLIHTILYWPFVLWLGYTSEERQFFFPALKQAIPFYRKITPFFRSSL